MKKEEKIVSYTVILDTVADEGSWDEQETFRTLAEAKNFVAEGWEREKLLPNAIILKDDDVEEYSWITHTAGKTWLRVKNDYGSLSEAESDAIEKRRARYEARSQK